MVCKEKGPQLAEHLVPIAAPVPEAPSARVSSPSLRLLQNLKELLVELLRVADLRAVEVHSIAANLTILHA